MSFIRQIIGVIYILCILIIAMDIMNFLLIGLVPPQLKGLTETIINTIDSITKILCYPVELLINIAAKYLPASIQKMLPVTNTGIFGAKLAWIPIISLFVYTALMNYIDNFIRSRRLKNIQQDDQNIMFVDPQGQNPFNNINSELNNNDKDIQGEIK